MADFVFENAAVKQYFTCVGDDDIRALQTLSSDKRVTLGGGSSRGLASTHSYREVITPSLEADTIRDVTARFGRSFFIVDDGSGHRNPVIVDQVHRYPDYSDKPMPLETLPAAAASARRRIASPPAAQPPAAAHWQAVLAGLWAEKQAAEQWEMAS